MWNKIVVFCCLIILPFFLTTCSEESDNTPVLQILSSSINGGAFQDGLTGVPTASVIELVFSVPIDRVAFESALSLNGNAQASIGTGSQPNRIVLNLELDPQFNYQLSIDETAIGRDGERLETPFERSFTTAASGVITSQEPCTSAGLDCLRKVPLTADGTADFSFYSSFPIYEEQARWDTLETAVIVVHGANRNAAEYFTWMTSSIQAINNENRTVLIAPHFKAASEADAEEYFWSSNAWREGRLAAGTAKISSFEVVDQLITQLARTDLFPAMKKIIITGHSSGGLFTHAYAAAGQAPGNYPALAFEYVVANSQYFYYPTAQRIDEATNQLYVPNNCSGYDFWPLGFNIAPRYLDGIAAATVNQQLVDRSVIYLLGNGNTSDPTFNDNDCAATLLGSSRFQRGENIYLYMELSYEGIHNHQRVVVEGIGHNGQAMYQATTTRDLFQQLLE